MSFNAKKQSSYNDGSAVRKPLCVLLLEDDDDDAYLISARFAKSDRFSVQIIHVKTCAAAAEVLSHGEVDLVISDYWLGQENSLDFLQTYSGRNGGLPALLLSGIADQEVLEAGLRAGANLFLGKQELSTYSLDNAVFATLHAHAQERELRAVIARQEKAVRTLSQICRKENFNVQDTLDTIDMLEADIDAAHDLANVHTGHFGKPDTTVTMAFQRGDLIACIDGACNDALCIVDSTENDIVFHKPLLPVQMDADLPFLRESLADIFAAAVGAIKSGFSLMVQTRIADGVCAIDLQVHSAAMKKGLALGDGMEGLEFAQYVLTSHGGTLDCNSSHGAVQITLPLRQ
jgi:CheY-like chemotaxis protein